MGVIEVKIIFNREDSISLVGKNKAKGFKQMFFFLDDLVFYCGMTQVEF